MFAFWAKLRAEGKTSVPLSPEGIEKRRQASRRTMRMRWAREDAAAAAEEMMRLDADYAIRMFRHSRRQIILKPYLTALDRGGIEEFYDLAEVAGFDLRDIPDGTELTELILTRYAPDFNIAKAAEDLRKGAAN